MKVFASPGLEGKTSTALGWSLRWTFLGELVLCVCVCVCVCVRETQRETESERDGKPEINYIRPTWWKKCIDFLGWFLRRNVIMVPLPV